MCGRFTVTTKYQKIIAAWPLTPDHPSIPNLVPSYNIAPTQNVLAVWNRPTSTTLTVMRWGFLPPWAKDLAEGARMINARAETLAERPSFKRAYREQRCLIIADGFYEWRKTGKDKQPVRIVLKSRALFSFAGLWSIWKDTETGAETVSCAIITCAANVLVQQIHGRMPVILPKAKEVTWLDPALKEPADLQPLLTPYPAHEMEIYPVSKAVNTAAVNNPSLIEPASP